MAELGTLSVNDRIKIGLDGRSNKWLKGKLADRGIILSDSSLSQRLSGEIGWTGEEAIACFELLNIEILEPNA